MRLFQCLSSFAGNFKLPKSSSKYLQTVFHINLFHDNVEISGDFLIHEPAKISRAVIDEVDASVKDFVKSHGFLGKNDLDRVTGPGNFSAVIPNLTMEQHRLVGKFVAAHLLVDDFFDVSSRSQQLDRCSRENIDMVSRMNRFLSEYIRCNALPIDNDIRVTFPKFEDGCLMYYETGTKLLEFGDGLEHIYRGFDILVGGNVTQAKFGMPNSKEEYLDRKRFNSGFVFYFELCALLAGYTLTQKVRDSAVFQKFQKCLTIMGAISVDPMSVLFDESQGLKNDNYTLILIQQGFSVKDAVRATIILYNQLFVESLVLISQLDAMNVSESDRRCLRIYHFVLRGSLGFPTNHILYNRSRNLKHREIDDKVLAERCVLDALNALPTIDEHCIVSNDSQSNC